MLAALLKDGDLLDKAVGGEDGVQGVHSHGIHHVLHLRQLSFKGLLMPYDRSDTTSFKVALLGFGARTLNGCSLLRQRGGFYLGQQDIALGGVPNVDGGLQAEYGVVGVVRAGQGCPCGSVVPAAEMPIPQS